MKLMSAYAFNLDKASILLSGKGCMVKTDSGNLESQIQRHFKWLLYCQHKRNDHSSTVSKQ